MQARAAACFDDLIKVDDMITHVKDAAAGPSPDPDDTPAATGTGGNRHRAGDPAGPRSPSASRRRVDPGVLGVAGRLRLPRRREGGPGAAAAELDTAVSGFLNRMNGSARGRKVTMLVYSEFGRRVKANASDGTDHGTASNVFVLGSEVAGGALIGEQPSLTDLDNGDLKAATTSATSTPRCWPTS
jgi:hypothetical protein